ncbi:MAG: hypothetical protein U1E23_17680 [Reyranellaceae bacterium]
MLSGPAAIEPKCSGDLNIVGYPVSSVEIQSVWFGAKPVSFQSFDMPQRLVPVALLVIVSMVAAYTQALAQVVESRHWQGATAATRQPEHVVATTLAEWQSLWSRAGVAPPEGFEPGRTNAVGIFLGRRSGEGFGVNVLSATRRRDRIVVVFEERMPPDVMLAQRVSPGPPARASMGGGSAGFSGGAPFAGATGFASPGAVATVAPPPPARPTGPPTSPWAIVLIQRSDLPISVEQRLFR